MNGPSAEGRDPAVARELLVTAFRKACCAVRREELLTGGTFESTSTFFAAQTDKEGRHEGSSWGDEDEATVGVTFVFSREDEWVELGRIDHDVDGLALRLRRVSCQYGRAGQNFVSSSGALSEREMREGRLDLLLDFMNQTPELRELEEGAFRWLTALPLLPNLLELVGRVTGLQPRDGLRSVLYHDFVDEHRSEGFGFHRVVILKLHTFQLQAYPRTLYFDDHFAGPLQLLFWARTDNEGRRLLRIGANPYYQWWHSQAYEGTGGCAAPHLHVEAWRYISATDRHVIRRLCSAWDGLANTLAAELGTPDTSFEVALPQGSWVHVPTAPEDDGRVGPETWDEAMFGRTLPRRLAPVIVPSPQCIPPPPEEDPTNYIRDRLNAAPPAGCRVVPGSTPVVAFGDWTRARVATVGLNPSCLEFVDANGFELNGGLRRLHTRASLGLVDGATLSEEQADCAAEWCRTYFEPGRNPYRRWFDHLENIVNGVGASYDDGTACHLDVAQWATTLNWSRLSQEQRTTLVLDGRAFFLEQLRRLPLHLLLLNGMGVISGFQQSTRQMLEHRTPEAVSRTVTCRFYCGEYDGLPVIGWSANLQSTPGVTNELRDMVRRRVLELADTYFVRA